MGRLIKVIKTHRVWAIFIHPQYIPRNMHMVFALLCFVVVIHWLIFPYPSGLLHWHCGNLTIAPVPANQLWWIWINTSCEFIMNDCITTTKQSTTKPCAYFLGYTVYESHGESIYNANWLYNLKALLINHCSGDTGGNLCYLGFCERCVLWLVRGHHARATFQFV